jgi:hypothetical protein
MIFSNSTVIPGTFTVIINISPTITAGQTSSNDGNLVFSLKLSGKYYIKGNG